MGGADATGTDGTAGTDYGIDAFVWGLKVVFYAYAAVLVLRVAGPAVAALGLAQRTGPYSSRASGAVLVVLLIGLAVALFLGLFLATFLFLALHNAQVVLSSSATVSADAPSLIARSPEYTSGGSVALTPELFFPPELAWVGYLVPPAFLAFAGYAAREIEEDVAAAVVEVVIGYAFMAAITIVPVTWLFNAFVGPTIADLASSTYTTATIEVTVRSLLEAHVVIGLVYPAIFGGLGAVAAEATGGGDGAQS